MAVLSRDEILRAIESGTVTVDPFVPDQVGPGSIDTDMMASVNADPDAMKMVMSRTPLKRIGTPREIGDVVAFLASAKASYITGETIYVDGGRLGMNYTC